MFPSPINDPRDFFLARGQTPAERDTIHPETLIQGSILPTSRHPKHKNKKNAKIYFTTREKKEYVLEQNGTKEGDNGKAKDK
ncbi:hypothetical protein JTE90_027810 [Oedothorax gibbosus]|uniref:Uncharacterized protein n=1 Tax=Oedothorax gibbosus TaxID=931172 RepID=A0AAV6V7D3_9ARAC|nr:hypothetical protein JTE90_027810 [Oedothorax gibbosus]